ncbi:hypothetical protein AMAG_17550 [Allomyces macrogynus ATCC 38327]|uniref:TRP C-terminal domain-containing protein n=1 Tax=Allomyces macrogynus (strain ATCC 38327) TaxID=578462 RepID=A0A0L0TF82_ALLM3|nr:hypothetical protein AMAG_17550 [Allomyces macrogynus ATCC 38327]|eukprot:KNE73326.1 hypothetical protein AMAG_17550 [Allomyces macrogynus ATCC 38327]
MTRHPVLLGATFSYLLWVSLNRVYAQAMMGAFGSNLGTPDDDDNDVLPPPPQPHPRPVPRMALIIVLFISLRLLTSIRLESDSSASCYIWILCRSTISLFGIFALNLFYQTQMFTLNLANVVQYLTVMHARTNAAGFCALVEDDVVPLTVLTIMSFGLMLVMNVALLVNRTAFTAYVRALTIPRD